MKTKLLLTIAAVMLLFSGCGYKEGVRSEARGAYLYFSGNIGGAQVRIDGEAAFEPLRGPQNRYAVTPGKHTVEVTRDGSVVLKRLIFVDDGVAREISVR